MTFGYKCHFMMMMMMNVVDLHMQLATNIIGDLSHSLALVIGFFG